MTTVYNKYWPVIRDIRLYKRNIKTQFHSRENQCQVQDLSHYWLELCFRAAEGKKNLSCYKIVHEYIHL